MTEVNVRQQTSSSRSVSTSEHEMYRDLSDNTENEYSIEAFRQKLDELTESFDNNINIEKILQDAKNTTPEKQVESIPRQDQSDRKNAISIGTDDPILVKTTPQLRRFPMMAADFSGIPATGTGRTSRRILPSLSRQNAVHRSNESALLLSSPEPPTPVKTPLRPSSQGRPFHNSTTATTTPTLSGRRYVPRSSAETTAVNTQHQQRNTTGTSSSMSQERTRATGATTGPSSARPTASPLAQRHHWHPPNESSTNDYYNDKIQQQQQQDSIMMQLNEMHQILERHEGRIRQLEYENDALLQQRLRLPNTTYGIRSGYSSEPRLMPPPNHDDPPRSSRQSSQSRRTHYESPGKQFVAEFVQIMNLPLDYHEPLSNIMDRQFFARHDQSEHTK